MYIRCPNCNGLLIHYFQTVIQNEYEQDPYANEFGINVSSKLTSVEARVLPAPWVIVNII